MSSSARLQTPWKGKAKATEQDFADLNPTITYRHLLAHNLGVKDPLRVIALCDSDAFYAACEMVRLGVDKDTPLVVLQWDALIAINYPARKYGISRLKKLNLKEVKEKHPDLLVVHVATYKEGAAEPGYWDDVDTKTHKVSLDYYRRESLKIASLFKECLPDCEIEKASIDEAFFDFTKPVRKIMLERYPYLAQVPADARNGVDTPLPPPPPIQWDGLGHVIPINPPPPDEIKEEHTTASPVPEKLEEDEDPPATWHDVALLIAAELMDKAREQVRVTLGYSTSAGIARNKFLAKLSASYKKPNSQSILRNQAIPQYLRPMPFQKIRFLGGKLGNAIAEEFGASTVGDLLSITLDDMQNKFGEESIWIYEVLRGIDRSEVKEKKSTVNKSMLASKNLPKPITNASEGFHWIRVLAAELALRLNEARETSPNLWPKSLVLHARKGYEAGRSKQAPFPFTREVTVDTIAAAGDKLWKELVGTSLVTKVTSVQLAFTGIETAEPGQRSIDGFLHAGSNTKRQRDDENDTQFGSVADNNDTVTTDNSGQGQSSNLRASSFVCTRCDKRISLPSLPTSSLEEEAQLVALRQEHDDFHFAQELAKESPEDLQSVSTPVKGYPKKKKRRKEPMPLGIEKFFSRT
ncbi:N-acetyltransferase eso1 [Hypsizygus marmoreus]|uniref:DNA polymerase eta n=1 Tax=Hypsizygus marmoreus TaxID=39966 RepID=A0A369JYQ8_HYPMA|nr:N-acetyltransferase eso1 [Hypsizygus marmoreus]